MPLILTCQNVVHKLQFLNIDANEFIHIYVFKKRNHNQETFVDISEEKATIEPH